MSKLPKKVKDRFLKNIKSMQAVVRQAKARDVNETDTVTVVKDILADVFGYDKYLEVTSEHQIRGTYVDLTVKVDGQIHFLIEVKAVGLDLRDAHAKQAVDYGANAGVEWVILTNGYTWRLYKIHFKKPIEAQLVNEFDFVDIDVRSESSLEQLFVLSKEGVSKSVLSDFFADHQATDKFSLAAVLLSETVLTLMRRELKRLHPDAKVGIEDLREALKQDVIKRDVIEAEAFDSSRKSFKKVKAKSLRKKRSDSSASSASQERAAVENKLDGSTAVGAKSAS